MADARERFWAGLRTELTFGANGLPQVAAAVIPNSGITLRTRALRLSASPNYRAGSVLDVNIGQYDQAYAILHGELEHHDPGTSPHLLVSWLYWEQDSEPVYQSDYVLDSSEVMPSDEIDIVPITAVGEIMGNPAALPRRADDCTEDCVIFWKRSHVYSSAEGAVMTINEASRQPAYVRQPIVSQPSYQAASQHMASIRAMDPAFSRASQPSENARRQNTQRHFQRPQAHAFAAPSRISRASHP